MGHNARAHGPHPTAYRKDRYKRHFAIALANKAKHKAKAALLLEAKLLKYR